MNREASCLILNYKSFNEVNRLVSNIVTYDFFYEIIVIDNCSLEDKQLDELKSKNKNLVLIKNKINCGLGGGLKKGIEYLKNDKFNLYIYILGSDISLDASCLDESYRFLKENNKYGIISPLMKDANDKLDINIWKKDTYLDYIKKCFFFSERRLIRKQIKKIQKESTIDKVIDGFYVRGSFMAIRKEAIKETLFDETIFLYEDDKAAGYRIINNGYLIGAITNCYYYHLHNYSKKTTNYASKSSKIFMKKYLKYSSFRIMLYSFFYHIGRLEKTIIVKLVTLKNRRNQK